MWYSNLTLLQLKNTLKSRGCKVSGKKKALVDRLESLDAICRAEPEMDVEFAMSLPDISTYSDVHVGKGVPEIQFQRIYDYFLESEKSFTEKYHQLYKQRYLRHLRMSVAGDLTFFTSSVWAEMRKSVSYKVDVAVDVNRVIVEAQCECGAGQGPTAHCKHIACTLLGVHDIGCNGSILTETTCTQSLQSFHRSKPHVGSPMRSKGLEDLRGQDLVFDPRPQEFRNRPSYPDYFRSTVLNFQSCDKMPATQLFQPANASALAKDHENDLSEDEEFFATEMDFFKHLRVLEISLQEARDLERETRGQAENQRWLSERKKRITASNFGNVCKCHSPGDKLALRLVEPREFSSRATSHGRQYESVAVDKFESIYGPTADCGLFVCGTCPWLAASPDRLFGDDAVVEIKCPFTSRDRPISQQTVPYLRQSGSVFTLDPTHDYYYQIQGQLLCTGRVKCFFCVFTLVDFVVVEIGRDEAFITVMSSQLSVFFHKYMKSALLDKYKYHNYYKYF